MTSCDVGKGPMTIDWITKKLPAEYDYVSPAGVSEIRLLPSFDEGEIVHAKALPDKPSIAASLAGGGWRGVFLPLERRRRTVARVAAWSKLQGAWRLPGDDGESLRPQGNGPAGYASSWARAHRRLGSRGGGDQGIERATAAAGLTLAPLLAWCREGRCREGQQQTDGQAADVGQP